jgi:hypothetical protein
MRGIQAFACVARLSRRDRVHLAVLVSAVSVLISASPVGAYLNNSPVKAYWANLGPTPVQGALRFAGRTYSAGVAFYRLGVGTVPAYSLSLGSRPSPGIELEGVDPASSSINGLQEATYLAGCSSKREVALPLRPSVAAAYQIAIWHFTNDVPLSRQTVASRSILLRATSLAIAAERAVESHSNANYCEPVKSEGLSGAAWGAAIKVVTGTQSVSDQGLNIYLSTGSENQYPIHPQALEVRVNGVPAFVCTGARSMIKTGREVDLPVKPPCGEEFGPHQLQFRVHATPIAGPKHAPLLQRLYAQATISVPRRDYPQQIEVLWNSKSESGAVYVPPDGSEPIITAGIAFPDVVETVTIQPANLSDFGFYLQRTLLAWIASLGVFGLIPLAVIVLILITAPVWFLGATRRGFAWLSARTRRKSGSGDTPGSN